MMPVLSEPKNMAAVGVTRTAAGERYSARSSQDRLGASASACESGLLDPRMQLAAALGEMVAWEKDVRSDWVVRTGAAQRLLGFGSTTGGALRGRVHSDDIKAIDALQKGSATPCAFRYLHPDGRLRWLEGCSCAVIEDGEVVKVYGFLKDVTAERAARSGSSAEGLALGEMRAALEAGQFIPYYQPQIRLDTGALAGVEALARWNHPTQGVLGPQAFLSAFAEGELALDFGRALRTRVIADVKALRAALPDAFTISVNLCGFELRDPSLCYRFAKDIRNAGLDPSQFIIEITEDTQMAPQATDEIRALVESFHKRGFKVAFDDFGTGYASLKQLRCAGIDQIKIDRSFVKGLGKSEEDASIIAAMLHMGQGMHVDVVAEGVETAKQAQALAQMGCRTAQGYLYAQPLSAVQFGAFLETWRPAEAIRHIRPRRTFAKAG